MEKHREGCFLGMNGLELFYQSWVPEGKPRGVLALVHGECDNSGCFRSVIAHAVPRGFAVYAFDLRGHGRSDGLRGHVRQFDLYHGDVQAFLGRVYNEQPGLPIFLMGFSIGGLIVADYMLRQPPGLRGVILMSVPFKPSGATWLLTSRLFAPILPRLRLNLKQDPQQLTRDMKVIASEREEAQGRNSYITARWGAEVARTIKWVNAHADMARQPLLIQHGTGDLLYDVDGAREFYEDVLWADKTLKIYAGAYHALYNDLDRAQVISDLVDWMEAHLVYRDEGEIVTQVKAEPVQAEAVQPESRKAPVKDPTQMKDLPKEKPERKEPRIIP